MTDEELLHQLKLGNGAALEAIVYRYHGPIQTYITRMVKNSTIAEDLTQECFMRVCLSIQSGRLPDSVRPWIYRIATNLCKDLWKKASFRREQLTEHGKLTHLPERDTVASILERQWEREEVIRSLDQLSEDNREIVILRFYQELKLEEIAEIVDMPLNTLKSRLYKSLKKLAVELKKEEKAHAGTSAKQGT